MRGMGESNCMFRNVILRMIIIFMLIFVIILIIIMVNIIFICVKVILTNVNVFISFGIWIGVILVIYRFFLKSFVLCGVV